MSISAGNKANIFFIACLFVYAFMFVLYLEYFYEVAPYGTEIIHTMPLLTWLLCLFFTSPLGHALNDELQLQNKTEKICGRSVPTLRQSLLIVGILVQCICLIFDVVCLNFFLSCEAPYCPLLGARLFGVGIAALILLGCIVIATAVVKLMNSYELAKHPRTLKIEEKRDRLLVVRVIAHASRLLFFVLLIANASMSVWGDILLAACASVIDIEWLTLCLLHENDASFAATACDMLHTSKFGKALNSITTDMVGENRQTFYKFMALHFALNGGILAMLLLKAWVMSTLLNSALLILTFAVLFFTAHDRFGLVTGIEKCRGTPSIPTAAISTQGREMRTMPVESSFTMRSRLKSFKLNF